MSRPRPHTTFLVKLAGRCASLAMIMVMLVACGTGDDPTPSPTAGIPVAPPPTESEPLLPPPISTAALIDDTDGVTIDDGFIPDGELLTPFDTSHPAISNLDGDLLAAVRRAAADATVDGIDLFVTSGWRSERYQQHLLDEGIATYGSEEEARKWVNTPDQSTHVSGNAIDIGPVDAYSWLSQHGNEYGLCQTYANEMWHYELATEPGGACPPQLNDASAGS